jgi:peptide/nickel transport system substrate-binding protein
MRALVAPAKKQPALAAEKGLLEIACAFTHYQSLSCKEVVHHASTMWQNKAVPSVIFLAAVAVVCLLLWHGAEIPKNSENIAPIKDALRVSIAYQARQCDSRQAGDAASNRLLNFVSYGLVRQNLETFAVMPAAAEVARPTSKTFVFTLKPNQNFHDGTPLDAKWVKDFYTEIAKPEMASPWLALAQQIKSMQVESAQVLKVELAKENPYIWPLFTLPLTFEKEDSCHGLGAYAVQEKVSATELTLENVAPQAHGPQQIVLKTQKNPLTRMMALQRGDVDVLFLDMPQDYLAYAKRQGLQVKTHPSGSYSYLGVNFRPQSPTADLRVRQAIHLALPRQEIVEHLFHGAAVWPASGLLLPTHPLATQIQAPEQDLDKARTLVMSYLKDKNKEDQPLKIDLMISNNEMSYRVATVLQQVLGDINIDLNITPMQWGALYERIRQGNFALYYLSWVGPFDVDMYQRLFHSTEHAPKGLNRSFYQDKGMDSLLEQMVSAKNAGAAARVQAKVGAELLDIPLWRSHHTYIATPQLQGCGLNVEAGYETLLGCKKPVSK